MGHEPDGACTCKEGSSVAPNERPVRAQQNNNNQTLVEQLHGSAVEDDEKAGEVETKAAHGPYVRPSRPPELAKLCFSRTLIFRRRKARLPFLRYVLTENIVSI